jgi:hypothetical protein
VSSALSQSPAIRTNSRAYYCISNEQRRECHTVTMPEYYQDQQRGAPMPQRPTTAGSVRLARERAEALAQEQMYSRQQQARPKWPSTIREDGRHYVPGGATQPTLNNMGYKNAEHMRPPPPVRGTTFYNSEHNSSASSVEDLNQAQNQQRDRGELAQDFQFPPVPKSNSSSPQRGMRNQRPQMRQQAPTQTSPGSPAWPLPKPSHAQAGQAQPTPMQRNVHPTIANQANPYDRESVYSRQSEPSTPPAQHGVLRQASQGKRAKPVLTTIQSPVTREQRTDSQSRRASTVNALSAAITAGMAPSNSRPHTPQSQAQSSSMRMPFSEDSPPPSPIDEKLPLEPPRVFGRSPIATSDSSTSTRSHNPLLSKDPRPAMSDKIPSSRRPPRLNIDAVRELESRGSTTSLTDLIRRATKLASNLDRGKTASRLGMLDMFNAGEKEEKRKSGSISDMLSAFPEPGMTPTSARQHDPRFPPGSSHLRNGEFGPRDSRDFQPDKSNARRCCGMSLTAFFIVMFVLFILIAAAVLVPIFLIVIPRMHNSSTSLASCSTSHKCQNMGISVVSDNTCNCVCTNGYTGDHCQLPLDAECSTMGITIDGKFYNDATAGSSLPDVLSGASKNFSIPLNGTALLSLFAANNLTCTTENSLVSFNVQTENKKRFLPVHIPMPTTSPSLQTLKARIPQSSTVGSSNGIVFQASSTSSTAPSSATSSSTESVSPSDTSSTKPVSQKILSFAQVVVLYVFEQSSSLSIAVNAQQTMQSYLANVGGNANGTLSVGYKDLHISADFKNFEILWANGTDVGGGKQSLR